VNLLVAAYLGHKPDPAPSNRQAPEDDTNDPAAPATWLGGGAKFPASPQLAAATTPSEALAAAERMFYGTVLEYPST